MGAHLVQLRRRKPHGMMPNMNPIKALSAVCCALLLAAPGLAGAAVYKCAGKDKQPVYQGQPCTRDQTGYEMQAQDSEGRGEASAADQLWINKTRPFFEANCPRMSEMARQAVGSGDGDGNVHKVCKCVTRKYFSGEAGPIAKLRQLDEEQNTARIGQLTAPLLEQCRKLNPPPPKSSNAGAQP